MRDAHAYRRQLALRHPHARRAGDAAARADAIARCAVNNAVLEGLYVSACAEARITHSHDRVRYQLAWPVEGDLSAARDDSDLRPCRLEFLRARRSEPQLRDEVSPCA
jgi:hypothetical protein